jgi:cyanate permease
MPRPPADEVQIHTIPPDPVLNGSPTAEQQHDANEAEGGSINNVYMKSDDKNIDGSKGTASPAGDLANGDIANPTVNKRPVPWKKIFKNKYTWAIIVNQYCNCWGFFVLLQWLPSYYRQQFGTDLKSLGLVSIVPYCVQFTAGLAVGFIADWMVNTLKVPLVYIRKGSQTIALLGAALFMLLAGFVAQNIVQGVIFITCALGINSLSNVGLSVAHFDINPEFAGVIFGLGNTAATLTGIIGVQATGLILQWTGSWALVFLAAAFHYVIGVIVWLAFAHPDRKLILTP